MSPSNILTSNEHTFVLSCPLGSFLSFFSSFFFVLLPSPFCFAVNVVFVYIRLVENVLVYILGYMCVRGAVTVVQYGTSVYYHGETGKEGGRHR